MKKSLIALAVMAFSVIGNAQETDKKLGEVGEKVYMECMSFSDKMALFFNKDMQEQYQKDCPSLAFFIDNVDVNKKQVITTITSKDFNPTILVSANPDEFMSNMGLITSLLIESPQEKLELIEYINGDAEKHSPEDRQNYIDELNKKYRVGKIDNVLYSNLVKSLKVIEKDSKRITALQEQKMKRIVNIAEKFKDENSADEEKVRMSEALIQAVSSGYNEEVELIEHYLKNLNKYLKSNKDANNVYRVFNSKNPLNFEKNRIPRYSKAECDVIKDWSLTEMIQEKHQINKIPGCK